MDKLDLRVPSAAPFTAEYREIGDALLAGKLPPGFSHAGRYYAARGDLREYGIDAFLHFCCSFGEHNHKLEFIDSGCKSIPGMLDEVRRVWDVDPHDLGVMRIDLAADVVGVPVWWFKNHGRFDYKRFSSRIDKASAETEVEFVQMGTATGQTIYAGKRPNLVRIYDKTADWKREWLRQESETARFNQALAELHVSEAGQRLFRRTPQSFASFCEHRGHVLRPGEPLTRVERQIGGGRVPPEFKVAAHLFKLADFNPFERIRFVGSQKNGKRPGPPGTEGGWEGSMRDWLAGIGLETLVGELGGFQPAASLVTRYGNGNGRRILDDLTAFIPDEGTSGGLTEAALRELYRQSVLRQLELPGC